MRSRTPSASRSSRGPGTAAPAYCGEWIESHALHVYLLHLPDFLGYPSALDIAADHRAAVEAGLTLKKAGNRLVELIGGRAIHPVSVRVGGFSRPSADARSGPRPGLDEALGSPSRRSSWSRASRRPSSGARAGSSPSVTRPSTR